MEKYIKLLQSFADSKINADQFEQQFLEVFKSDNNLQGIEFRILDKLFADVDAYCSDPDLIEDPRFDIGEVQLQVSAKETLDKLLKLTPVLTSKKIAINEQEESKEAILADFSQAWHEAMTGKTIPVVKIWEGIDDV
ncbi:MAG: hypothetical protein EAZ09_16940 [Oscillatoriales cyanobacterium]|nr:MAG: hypothetical protein EAZ18_16360 [Oscillatoriales cyanobacterium]TAH19051.1 MAG: hypothetical protein EAZ09_16940 [Oscillatoriales cyanobacterium]